MNSSLDLSAALVPGPRTAAEAATAHSVVDGAT